MNTTDVIPLVDNPTLSYYEKKACELFESCKFVDNGTIQYIRKFHPNPENLTGMSNTVTAISMDDARHMIAREHGFLDVEEFEYHIRELMQEGSATRKFELAVESCVRGDAALLKALLTETPELVESRSSRAHRAKLVHYVAANGTENYRQEIPPNAADIAEVLLSAGCEADAIANLYDRKWGTTLDLTVSSTHAAKAGVQLALVEKLLDYGASINGVRDDGSPLATAIYFRQSAAADTLVKRGARIDNVVTAAAMGQHDILEKCLDGGGKLLAHTPLISICWLDSIRTPQANLELALVWAAMLNRVETVAYMLDRGVSAASRDQNQWTALHWASCLGLPEMVDLLLRQKAPLEARNELGGTVLDQTLWATIHEGVGPYHLGIITKLIDAGAKIHSWWLFAGLSAPLDDRVAQLLQRYDI